jgi:septal ring factor EnvC (AmiA/AmiB activator)
MRLASPLLGLALAAAVGLLAAGCGQEVKRENQQLKSQIATLQQENTDLKGQVTTLRADTDALKKQLEDVTKERQALEDKLKEAEARAAAKPGTKPPLKPKRSS